MSKIKECIDSLLKDNCRADDTARELIIELDEAGQLGDLCDAIVDRESEFELTHFIMLTTHLQFYFKMENPEVAEFILMLEERVDAIEDEKERKKWDRRLLKNRKRKESAESKDNEIKEAVKRFAERRDKLFTEYSIGEVKDIDEYIAKLIEADRGIEVGKLFYEQGKEIMQYCTKLDFEVLRDGDIHTFMIGAELQKHGQMDLQIAHDLGLRDDVLDT